MARCDEGYPCATCGGDVEAVIDSDLYLRFVLGEVPLDVLHLAPERHVRCHPALAQYVVHPAFEPVECEGFFDKRGMDPAFVRAEEARVTTAWRRLQAVPTLGLAIPEYPLAVTAFSEGETPGGRNQAPSHPTPQPPPRSGEGEHDRAGLRPPDSTGPP